MVTTFRNGVLSTVYERWDYTASVTVILEDETAKYWTSPSKTVTDFGFDCLNLLTVCKSMR